MAAGRRAVKPVPVRIVLPMRGRGLPERGACGRITDELPSPGHATPDARILRHPADP